MLTELTYLGIATMKRLATGILLALCILPRASRAEEKVYFGLLHGHTSFSDGSGKPDDAFKMARDAGLSFFAVTEHNHKQAAGPDGIFLTPALHSDLVKSARDHTKDGQFVAIWGQEVS